MRDDKELTEKPEAHIQVRVTVDQVVPAHLTKERYSSTSPTRIERSVAGLLEVVSRDTDERSAIEDAIAYLEVRLEKLAVQREQAQKAVETAEVGLVRRPIKDTPQA